MRSTSYLSRLALLGLSLVTASCTIPLVHEPDTLGYFGEVPEPSKLHEPSVMKLAHEIDRVEKHLDWFGTIVAKQPDIWGEARLTKHRQEYEVEMAKDLTAFEVRMNAAVARSDQAYLASALALSAAATPALAQNSSSNGGGLSTQNVNVASSLIPGISAVPSTATPTPTALPSTTQTQVFQTAPFGLLENAKLTAAGETIGLEPTIVLDQKSRYLQHLHELRRISEGDDTSDAPGYSLNLVRIPVSVIPGKRTRKGYGAEIAITATPCVGEDLLPKTFRTLVLNDLIDMLGIPVLEFLEVVEVEREVERQAKPTGKPKKSGPNEGEEQQRYTTREQKARATLSKYLGRSVDGAELGQIRAAADRNKADRMQNILAKLAAKIPTSLQRRARLPLPPSQIIAVLGQEEILTLSRAIYWDPEKSSARKAVTTEHGGADDVQRAGHRLILDVHKFIGAELEAAYDLVSLPFFVEGWWSSPYPHQLFQAIRSNDYNALTGLRQVVMGILDNCPPELRPQISAVTPVMVWAICVESSLLNERLIEDMQHVASAKGCPCMVTQWLPFYGPFPPPESREAFRQYVACRWPIHVFALDPVTQDQNIMDAFASRRELQLAYSLAFVQGRISAQQLTRFTRRIEYDAVTIALNRTAVGFAHGNDTFGWRFMPRYQTPDIPGNLTVIFRDLLWGGPSRDHLLRESQLESGMRECTAVVIMPSFVPYVTFDVKTNWFKLTNPKQNEPDLTDAMRLSRAIKTMQETANHVRDEHKYRDGDLCRLVRRVEQLSVSLPLQSMMAQVPVENTLGGFELFASGVTDLAPELIGYYGEPGVGTGRESTFFLVGDNFSIHETRVLAGNTPCGFRLLSRRVLEVTVPAGVCAETDPETGGKMVDFHVATPYGVSGHVKIPVDAECQGGSNPFVWGVPTAYKTSYKMVVPPGKTVAELDMGPILPPTGELHIETSGGVYWGPQDGAKLIVTVVAGGKIVASAETANLIQFDSKRQRFVLFGTALDGLQKELQKQINVAYGTAEPSGVMTVSGKLRIGTTNGSVIPIENQISVTLQKQ